MSIRVSAWAWELECNSSGEKLVLLALSDHAGDDGTCRPGTARLSEKTGIGDSTVRKHLDALAARGVISRTRRRRPDGKLGGYRYTLNVEQTTAATSAVADENTSAATSAVDQRRPVSAPAPTHERSTADGSAVRTVTEPSMDQERATDSQARRPAPTAQQHQDELVDELLAGYRTDFEVTHGGDGPPAAFLGKLRAEVRRELKAGRDPDLLALALGHCAEENRTALPHVLADLLSQRARAAEVPT